MNSLPSSPWDALTRPSPSLATRRTKASQIRDFLSTGPKTAADIAVAVDIPSAAVYQALKRDLRAGRVVFENKHYRQKAGEPS